MRVRLSISPVDTNRVLPVNDQHEFSAWIYKMIHYGDEEFAVWLHNKGCVKDGKSFRLFTFSNRSKNVFNST